MSASAAVRPLVPTLYESNILGSAPTLNPTVLNYALWASQSAKKHGINVRNQHLTIIDYSLPSTQPRLWVIDLTKDKSIMNLLVAHGANSGDLYAKHFSNRVDSHESSLGLFLTGDSYKGPRGYSLVLSGLDKGFNSNARKRSVVLHSNDLVNFQEAAKGSLIRSWGCIMVDSSIVDPLINTIKDGSLLFAYYPDKHWLGSSDFLR